MFDPLDDIDTCHEETIGFQFPLSTPRIVHCSAGAGRTGCYIVLSRVLDQLERKATQMDIKRLVGELR